jgi:dihydroorotate dehydrogenase electron transfer subunit
MLAYVAPLTPSRYVWPEYTAVMASGNGGGRIVDVAATIVANHRLSEDYNVLSLSAPEIAEHTAAGQFVMIKVGTAWDPLLRRPFSVFEVLRDAKGVPSGISILSKRIGVSTHILYHASPGQPVACLGPLGRPFTVIEPPTEAWMIAGGVGLAPFATLAQALSGRGVRCTLFYGARRASELFYLDFFRSLGVRLVLTTEDGSMGERGRVVAPLDRMLSSWPRTGRLMLYACGPEAMLAATARVAAAHERPCQVSVERIMGCGLGGCYSCVVPMRNGQGGFHHVRSCISGPVIAADQIAWEQQVS